VFFIDALLLHFLGLQLARGLQHKANSVQVKMLLAKLPPSKMESIAPPKFIERAISEKTELADAAAKASPLKFALLGGDAGFRVELIRSKDKNYGFLIPFCIPSPLHRTIIYLPNDPDATKPLDRFCVLHEMGHAGGSGVTDQTDQYIIAVLYGLVALLVLLFGMASWHARLLLILGSILAFKAERFFARLAAELGADRYAVWYLVQAGDVDSVFEVTDLLWKPTRPGRFRWSIADIIETVPERYEASTRYERARWHAQHYARTALGGATPGELLGSVGKRPLFVAMVFSIGCGWLAFKNISVPPNAMYTFCASLVSILLLPGAVLASLSASRIQRSADHWWSRVESK
jgi:hypothetical protein